MNKFYFNYTEKMLCGGSVVEESEIEYEGTEADYEAMKEKWNRIAFEGYYGGYRCYEEPSDDGKSIFLIVEKDETAFVRCLTLIK